MFWADLVFPPINLYSIPRLPEASVWEKSDGGKKSEEKRKACMQNYKMQNNDVDNKSSDYCCFNLSIN